MPYFSWAHAEGPVSIISICLSSIYQLIERAHLHGIRALFTRREYILKYNDHTRREIHRGDNIISTIESREVLDNKMLDTEEIIL